MSNMSYGEEGLAIMNVELPYEETMRLLWDAGNSLLLDKELGASNSGAYVDEHLGDLFDGADKARAVHESLARAATSGEEYAISLAGLLRQSSAKMYSRYGDPRLDGTPHAPKDLLAANHATLAVNVVKLYLEEAYQDRYLAT